jgi:hypothetical protein
MLHEEHSNFTVSATAPSYVLLRGLNTLGRMVRKTRLQSLWEHCSAETRVRIQKMEDLSNQMITVYKENGDRDDAMPEDHPFRDTRNQVDVSGFGASVNTDGGYKLACILDYWRFRMTRPAALDSLAVATLIQYGKSRRAWSATSCAEWELWVTLLASPSLRPIPFAQILPMRGGMEKSGTWIVTPQHRPTSESRPQLRGGRREMEIPPYRVVNNSSWPRNETTRPPPGIPQSMVDAQRTATNRAPATYSQRPATEGAFVAQGSSVRMTPHNVSIAPKHTVQSTMQAPALKKKSSSFFKMFRSNS